MQNVVEEGDRYVTTEPCCASCVRCTHDAQGTAASVEALLAIQPYSHVFTAPAKGRWLHRSLLELFVKEFAYVAPPSSPSSHTEITAELSPPPPTSLDPCVTVPAYIEELCTGQLWLHGRESECRTAGRRYQRALYEWYATANGMTRSHPLSASADASSAALEPAAWAAVKTWLRGSMTTAEVTKSPSSQSVVGWLVHTAPQLLVLCQKDIVKHRVWRREGRLFASELLHITRYNHPPPQEEASSRHCTESVAAKPCLLVVSKPCGLPVHPSGAFHKNSVTSILEDVFGGRDRHRYRAVDRRIAAETQDSKEGDVTKRQPYISIVHAVRGFELVRVWCAPSESESESSGDVHGQRGVVGLDEADLHHLIGLVGPPVSPSPNSAVLPPGTFDPVKPTNAADQRHEQEVAQSPLKAFVVHRLDAATSGVLLFGLNKDSARQLAGAIANKAGPEAVSGREEGSCDSAKSNHNDDAVEEGEAAVEQVLKAINSGGAARGADVGLSSKTYVALVHGQVNVETLAHTQVGCTAVELPSADGPRSSLLLQRPIGCLSFHLSTYWSPGPQREVHWKQQQQQQGQAMNTAEAVIGVNTGAVAFETGLGSARKPGKKSKEEVMAKHARMRARTEGVRGAHASFSSAPELATSAATSTTAETADSSPQTSGGPSASTALQPKEAAFTHTMKSASTLMRVVWHNAQTNTTLVECQLLTGRTHQLRVHLATLGHPIVGDDKYTDVHRALGVAEWQRPGLDLDGVSRFYQHEKLFVEENSNAESSGGIRECVCPHRICLHARRYVLQLPGATSETLTAVAPLPGWASPP